MGLRSLCHSEDFCGNEYFWEEWLADYQDAPDHQRDEGWPLLPEGRFV